MRYLKNSWLNILFLLFVSTYVLANSVTNVSNILKNKKDIGVQFTFSDKVVTPKMFSANDHKILVFDFPKQLKISLSNQILKSLKNSQVKDVKIVSNKQYHRLIFVLNQPDELILTNQGKQSLQYTYKSQFPKKEKHKNINEQTNGSKEIIDVIKDIAFNKDESGNGIFTVKLPSENTNISIADQSDNKVVIKFHKLHISEDWAHVMNVTSFETPVQYISGKNGFAYSEFSIGADKPVNFIESRVGNIYKVKVEVRNATGSNFNSNKKITLNLQDINVRSALQILANFANINLVISDQVTGTVTLRLKDIPWQEALDIILVSESLGKRQIGNILYIAPSSEITAHEQAELAAKNAVEASEPLSVAYRQLNYAKAADILPVIQSSGAGFLGARGSISSDTRTNTVIIQDTQEGIDRVLAVIDRLDTPTKEVLVHARVVEINRSALEEIGFRFFVGNGGIPISAGSNVQGSVVGNNGARESGSLYQPTRGILGVPEAPQTGQSTLLLNFTRLFGAIDLNMELTALESLNKAKSLSNPRLVVADNLTAYIKQGKEIPFLQSTASGAASLTFKQAVLELLVTPQISPNNTITLDVTVKKDQAETVATVANTSSIITREIKTKLVVDNGETVVLGGVYEKSVDNTVRKVPLLGDIPLLGWLFRYKRNQLENRELLIFLTTTILE